MPDAMDVQVKHIPFCGARIWEFEFADRVVCRMWIKRPVMRIIGVIEICRNVAIMNMNHNQRGTGVTTNIGHKTS